MIIVINIIQKMELKMLLVINLLKVNLILVDFYLILYLVVETMKI